MSDRRLVLALESRLVNAWPAFEVALVEGWLLRFAAGYSRRANSASPILPGAGLDDPTLAAIRAQFAARGIGLCFRLTGLEAPGADAVLDRAGLLPHDASLVLTAPLEAGSACDEAVRIEPAPSPAWVAAAAAAYGGDKSNGDLLGRIVRLIRQPAAFATVAADGRASDDVAPDGVAWGLAVAERGYVGLYDIVVDPARRGRGVGRRLVAGLMEWGRLQGATRAYLQMRETNDVAHALYRSLGFATAYRYTQRIGPAPAR